MSLYGTRDAAANWEYAYAKECGSIISTVGLRAHVHSTHVLEESGLLSTEMTSYQADPKHQLKWLEEVMDKHFESKHTVMGTSSDVAKLLVMLNRKILWWGNGIVYILDKRH